MPDKPVALDDLVAFSESFLERYGPDSPKGVGDLRDDYVASYRMILEIIRPSPAQMSLLDFGCGLSTLKEVLDQEGPPNVIYSGLDLSDRFIAESRRKFPTVTYYTTDVLTPAIERLPDFDYVIMNGIFDFKGSHSDEEMFDYLRALVSAMFSKTRIGLAFSVVSKQVDWEREDLFHVPMDPLVSYLSSEVTRHIVIRHDYGMYEYTVYAYREPSHADPAHPARLLQPRS